MKKERYWYGRHRVLQLKSAFLLLVSLMVSLFVQQAALAANGVPGRVQVTDSTEAIYVDESGLTTPAASTTDVFVKPGSASKKTYIQRVELDYIADSYYYLNYVSLIKRSTAGSGGTSSSATRVPLDSNFAAATSTALLSYTANPTVGTSVGLIRSSPLFNWVSPYNGGFNVSSGIQTCILFDAQRDGGPVVLNSTSETVAVNFGGIQPGGSNNKVKCRVVYREK